MKKIINLYKKYEEIINYLIIGGLTTIVSLSVYFVCTMTILNPKNPLELQIANVLSWIFAVLFAYITNRIFVFKSKSKGNDKLKEFISFVSARLLTLIIDSGFMALLVSILSVNDKISKILVQIIVIVLNYIFSKLFVFKKN